MTSDVKLQDGFWANDSAKAFVTIIKGNQLQYKNLISLDYPDIFDPAAFEMEIETGDLGPAREEIKEATQADNYNVCLKWGDTMKFYGVANPEGDKLTLWGSSNKVEFSYKMTSQQIQERRDDRDPVDAPSCPHITPRPGTPGKVFWLSGPPGAGKSTTCQLMAREKGYRYFEADCTMNLVNPFTDIHVDNPSMASFQAKSLKGVAREDAEAMMKFGSEMKDFMTGQMDGLKFDKNARPVMNIMAKQVMTQRKRLGGDFAVAFAVVTRESREFLKKIMGPDLVFVVLNLTKECQTKRILARHPGDDQKMFQDILMKMFDSYEPAGTDEANAYNVTISEDMTRAEVMQSVLDTIKQA